MSLGELDMPDAALMSLLEPLKLLLQKIEPLRMHAYRTPTFPTV